ncbi:MAG: hypothetical protein GY832_23315 [Chloroflexi bacterium]|nr:hypothetical protein [Chloroflexota bacterium]
MKNNPYIGPRPNSRKDRGNFYGRNREARDLLAKIVAERVLVFYAQSGAGKSSLLNAKVIPALKETGGFHVLPMVRVGSELPLGTCHTEIENIYVFSTLMALTNGRIAPKRLRQHTLLSFLQEFYQAPKGDATTELFEESDVRPPLLIFDQFEEIFTTHRNRWQDAKGFFQQAQEVLGALPSLGIVFSMRKDYHATCPNLPAADR